MEPLGPLEPAPRLAVAVSGGPDSMALALLAHEWACARGGSVLALIVDHGLRPEAPREAAEARDRLASRGIAARVLRVEGLRSGPSLAERAREARYTLLRAACADAGILHLLLGHHAADQAETLMMRALSGSGPRGMAGMAALVETPTLRLLRPLLSVPPASLRATLQAAGMDWVEDPSNADLAALRPRLRALRADPAGDGPATRALAEAAAAWGIARANQDGAIAAFLAEHVAIRPEGFAILPPGPMPADALAAIIGAIGGGTRPGGAAVAALAAAPGPSTIGGVRLIPAGKFGPGLLAVREASAVAPPVPAVPGAVWDARFRLAADAAPPPGAMLGALGAHASALRRATALPSAVLRVLPALFDGEGQLVAVPPIGWPNEAACAPLTLIFAPPRPAAPSPFVPSVKGDAKLGDAPYVVDIGGAMNAT